MAKLDKIKLGLTFDDVLLVPAKSEIVPSEAILKTKATKNISMNIPIFSSAMDTVTESETAIALGVLGGIGIIHKNLPVEEQAKEVRKVKRYSNWIISDPVTISPENTILEAKELIEKKGYSSFPVVDNDNMLIGILTKRDIRCVSDDSTLIKEAMVFDPITTHVSVTKNEALKILHENKIEKLPVVDKEGHLAGIITLKDIVRTHNFPNACLDGKGRIIVGAAIGPHDFERAAALAKEDVDIIVLDTAHGHSKNVIDAIIFLKSNYPKVDIIAGNVATMKGTEELILAGADAIKVGIGPGSICTTRIVSGTGIPQITAISDCYSAAKKQGVPIIADGGIRYSGDLAKALAAGASSVMMGSTFAGTEESPGEIIFIGGRKYKQYRGMGSISAMMKGSKDRYFQNEITSEKKLVAEGIEGVVPYKGKISEVVYQMLGGLRSAMGYCGTKTITELNEMSEFIRITNAGLKESHPHDVMITSAAPNYPDKP
ncbi:MAG: IMP dehydrogenase [archaeon]